VPIIGTSVDSIDVAENRERFAKLVTELGLLQPANGTAVDESQALRVARRIGFPILVRPSFVLGGRDMKIVYDEDELSAYIRRVEPDLSRDRPVLIDQFLENATEVDVDCLSDGTRTVIGGVMQHIEEAGHPLRRLGVRDPAVQPPPGGDRGDQGADAEAGRGAEREGADEHPVRRVWDPGRRPTDRTAEGVHPGGEPAGQPHRAVRVEGDRRAARPARALVMVGKTLDELGVKDEVVPAHFRSRRACSRSTSSRGWTSSSARR
jgi:carbamoyl-phosphate synthase large subunit